MRFAAIFLSMVLSAFVGFAQPSVTVPYQTPWIRTNLNYATNASDARTRMGVETVTNASWLKNKPAGVTASGGATATTNASGVVNIAVVGSGGDVVAAGQNNFTGSNFFSGRLVANMYTTNVVDLATALSNLAQSITNTGPTILSFGPTVSQVEIGSTVSSTILNWTLSGSAPTFQGIDHSIGSISPGTLTATDSASYTTTRTYTLTVSNLYGIDTASASVYFLQKNYHGVSVNTSLNDAQIIALSPSPPLATSKAQTVSLSPSGQYMYIVFPASYGTNTTFTVNGFSDTDWVLTTRAFVNQSGYSSSYNIYRTGSLRYAPCTIVVQ